MSLGYSNRTTGHIRASRGECSRMADDAALRRIGRRLLLPNGEPGVRPAGAAPDEDQACRRTARFAAISDGPASSRRSRSLIIGRDEATPAGCRSRGERQRSAQRARRLVGFRARGRPDVHHRRAPAADRADDLLDIDPQQIGAGGDRSQRDHRGRPLTPPAEHLRHRRVDPLIAEHDELPPGSRRAAAPSRVPRLPLSPPSARMRRRPARRSVGDDAEAESGRRCRRRRSNPRARIWADGISRLAHRDASFRGQALVQRRPPET